MSAEISHFISVEFLGAHSAIHAFNELGTQIRLDIAIKLQFQHHSEYRIPIALVRLHLRI